MERKKKLGCTLLLKLVVRAVVWFGAGGGLPPVFSHQQIPFPECLRPLFRPCWAPLFFCLELLFKLDFHHSSVSDPQGLFLALAGPPALARALQVQKSAKFYLQKVRLPHLFCSLRNHAKRHPTRYTHKTGASMDASRPPQAQPRVARCGPT